MQIIPYKSKTEVRFARTKSFSFIKKATVRYTPNPNPTVTNEMYTKNKRTLVARMPSLSARREDT